MKQDMNRLRIAIPAKHPDVLKLLKIRPRWRQLLWLPWWYNAQTVYANSIRRKAKKENPPGPFCLAHAQLLAALRCDRKYIDVALEHVHFDTQCPDPRPWIQAYLDVGLTLCNLGHCRDGISYIEKAIALETRPDHRTRMKTWLCFRLNARVNPEKTLKLAEALANEKPEDTVVKAVLAKAYMDARRLDEAEDVIKAIVKEHPTRFGFLMAGLHFVRKDFQATMRAFDQYKIHRVLHFWLPEYDYKKALAYHYCNQRDKCRDQALRIRRRMKWDRFYSLDAIEKAGIERVPAIDEMIQSDEVDNDLVDTERILHYFKNVRRIIHLYIIEYRWYIISFLMVLLYFLAKLARYLL